MDKLLDAIEQSILDNSTFNRDMIRLLIADYAEEQYQDGYDQAIFDDMQTVDW